MENNKLIKYEGNLLKRVSNAITLTQKLLADENEVRTKEEELLKLKLLQKKYNITDKMLSDSAADLNPNRVRQEFQQKKK